MTHARLALGAWGEEQAAALLRRKGLTILERNLRTPVGEIDILARTRRELVFVEVKTRRSVAFGLPAEAVGPRKRWQILRAAQWVLADSRLRGLQPRFDVVSVLGDGRGEATLEHLEAAFMANEDNG